MDDQKLNAAISGALDNPYAILGFLLAMCLVFGSGMIRIIRMENANKDFDLRAAEHVTAVFAASVILFLAYSGYLGWKIYMS